MRICKFLHIIVFALCVLVVCWAETDVGNILFNEAMAVIRDDGSFSNTKYAQRKLEESANMHNNTRAISMLARCNLYSNFSSVPDFESSRKYFSRLVELTGSADAHFYLAFLKDNGLGGEVDHKDALVHLSIAASLDHPFALAALGFKYHLGIHVEISYDKACYLYYKLGEYVMRLPEFQIFPGRMYPKIKLCSDLSSPSDYVVNPDVLQYYSLTYNDEPETFMLLGQLYFFGTQGSSLNYEKARRYFETVASKDNTDAYGYLGNMYLHGFGVEQNPKTAMNYFKKGVEKNNAMCMVGMGKMYYEGVYVEADIDIALRYFTRASNKANPDAMYYMGMIHTYGGSSVFSQSKGKDYMKRAASLSHIKALFEYVKIILREGDYGDLADTLYYLKNIADRGLGSLLQEAYEDYESDKIHVSLTKYMLGAFLGYESAHMNAIYLLEKTQNHAVRFRHVETALLYNSEQARILMGDCYYYGLGVKPDARRAFEYYVQSERAHSGQASFNIAYMYEFGIGIEKDLCLAKRYYERTLSYESKSYIPIMAILFKLYMKQTIGSIIHFVSTRLLYILRAMFTIILIVAAVVYLRLAQMRRRDQLQLRNTIVRTQIVNNILSVSTDLQIQEQQQQESEERLEGEESINQCT